MKAHIPAFAHASFVEFVSAHAAKGDEDAARLLAKLPKRRPVKVIDGLTDRKEIRRAEHKASTGDLRAFVGERMAGKCEACWREVGVSWDLHHVESGPSRRTKQRAGSVLGICWDCHRAAHRGDLGVLNRIAVASPLDAEARKAATHRLAKIEEARR